MFKNRINWKFGIVALAFYGSDILYVAQLSQYPTVSVKVTGSMVSRINVSVRGVPMLRLIFRISKATLCPFTAILAPCLIILADKT